MIFKPNESGRTLLELLAVMVIMAIITISSILGYKAIVTKAEVKTVSQEILRIVVERQHEALTPKGNEAHSKSKSDGTQLEGSHGVEYEVKNLYQLKLIEINAIKNDEDLISGLKKYFDERNVSTAHPQTFQAIVVSNSGGNELYLNLRFKQFEDMTASQLTDYNNSTNCGSDQVWDDDSKSCVSNLCSTKTVGKCETCNSITGTITKKKNYDSCDYDEDGYDDDGYCWNEECYYTECSPAPNACQICAYGELTSKADGTYCDYSGSAGYCESGVCKISQCISYTDPCKTCNPMTGAKSNKSDGTTCTTSTITNGACESGVCKVSLCATITLTQCQASCNPLTGAITNKQTGAYCSYTNADTTVAGACKEGVCYENKCTEALATCEAYCDPFTNNRTKKENGAFCQYTSGTTLVNGVCNNGVCQASLCTTPLAECVESCNPLTGDKVYKVDKSSCAYEKDGETVAGACQSGVCKENMCKTALAACEASCDPFTNVRTQKKDGASCSYNNGTSLVNGYCSSGTCLESKCSPTLGSCVYSCDPSTGTITNKLDGSKCTYTDENEVEQEGYCISGVCTESQCKGKVLTECELSCNPLNGVITNEEDGTVCNYSDGDSDRKDGLCSSGTCKNKKYKYMRLYVTKTNGAGTIQLSELKLIQSDDSAWTYPSGISAKLSGCSICSSDETPIKLTDSKVGTKLCAHTTGYSVTCNCYVTFTFPEEVDLSVYNRWQWYTANDTATFYERNLKNYKLQFSQDGSSWVTVDSVTNGSAPAKNYELAYTGNISLN